MSTSSKTIPEEAPGRYGAGYGEKDPKDKAPAPTLPAAGLTAPAGLEPIDRRLDPNAPAATSDGTGAPVVFTPEDVHARPPDHPPTDAAPASEKAGLIFERS